MINCHVKNETYINSNHKMLVATMKTPYTKQARIRRSCDNKQLQKIDLTALSNATVRQNLMDDINRTLAPSTSTSTADEICSNLLSTIHHSIMNTVPEKNSLHWYGKMTLF